MLARFSFLLVLGLTMSGFSFASEPTCSPYNGSPYCRYEGKVERLYVNDRGRILLYFDTAIPDGLPESVGISGVSQRSAAVVSYESTPEFAKHFYSTALTASASGQKVLVQMREVQGGYLKIDRIWLKGN